MRILKGTTIQSRIFIYLAVLLLGSWIYLTYYAPISFVLPVRGYASWYSRNDPGVKRTTANNEVFNDRAMTCAIWGIPFNTLLKVTNQSNGRYVIVRVNDRGPHRRYVREGRVIDLTKAAFRRISPTMKGLIFVRVEKITGEG